MAVMRRVSQKQQQRQFKVAFNKTPTKWIREYRVALGLEWMEKDYSVKATAKELHYASDSHFIHDFKKVYSQSPYKMLRSKLGI